MTGLLITTSDRSRFVYTNPAVTGNVANTSSPGTHDVGAKLTAEHTGTSNWHVADTPSPSVVLPSSYCSSLAYPFPVHNIPSPQ